MNRTEKVLIQELLKGFDLDLAVEDDEVLSEALRRTIGDGIDTNNLVKTLKDEFFRNLRRTFREKVQEVRIERNRNLTEKQLWYLSALVFAESLINKPVPASLVFEILRCIGMEERKNYPNRYYFLRQLEDKGLIKSLTVVNSRADYLFCSTEDGKKTVDGLKAFNTLIELKERILNDPEVKKLLEVYSKDEHPSVELPKLLKASQIVSENDGVKVLLYGREFVRLNRNEIEELKNLTRKLGKFNQQELRKEYSSEKKAMAYIVYAYEKGWIKIAERVKDSVIFEVC